MNRSEHFLVRHSSELVANDGSARKASTTHEIEE